MSNPQRKIEIILGENGEHTVIVSSLDPGNSIYRSVTKGVNREQFRGVLDREIASADNHHRSHRARQHAEDVAMQKSDLVE